ncbi:MAG: TolC family protein [Bacteroidetes bacterium]|nr:TolC family protein [Bacteroidota bacterium]
MTQIRIFFFLLVLSGASYGQTSWTLQQCIDYALANNLSVKQSELGVELTKTGVNQSTATLFPSLNGFASNNYYFGRSIDPYTNQFTENQVRSNSFSLSSSLSLFEGFTLINSLKQSKLNYMSSKYDLVKVKNDMALNVATVYLQVLYNKELLAITTDQVDATKLQRNRMKRMEELGSASKGNLLDMESQLAADELRLITAQSAYNQSMLSLKQLLELDTVADFRIVVPEFPAPLMEAGYSDVQAIYLSALSNQPDVKSYEYKVLSAEKGLSIAKGAVYPRLSMSGNIGTSFSNSSQRVKGYNTSIGGFPLIGYTADTVAVYSSYPETSVTPILENTPFNDQLDANLSKSIGFSLAIPLFNAWSTHSNIKRARINLQQTQLGFEQTKKGMYKSIEQAVADAGAAYQKFVAGEKNVSAQQQSMNMNQQKYDVGLISTYDYLLAKNNFTKAKSDLLQAKFDYIFRVKVLDFYMGKSLSF